MASINDPVDPTLVAAVKAASTAAVAADKALVVSVSPNTPLTLGYAQGAATAGEVGPLNQAAVTTAAPSYTTGQTSPLSLTPAGGLRVDMATVAGTAPTTAGKVDVKGADGDMFVRQATAANLNAEVQGDAAADAPVSGNPVQVGGKASAAAPTDVSADGDAVPDWNLRSGAKVVQPTYAGVLQSTGNGIAGTGTPRVTVASDNTPFPVKVDQTTPGTTNAVSLAQIGATTVVNGGLAGSLAIGGTAAADAPVNSNPMIAGARASNATPTAMSADGDAVPLWTDRNGALAVIGHEASDAPVAGNPILSGGRASTATPTAMSADGDAVANWLDRSGASVVTGYVASDAPVAGNPVVVGGRASAAAPADMSADGDAVNAWHLRNGALAVQPTFAGALQSTAASGVPKVGIVGNANGAFDGATGAAVPANALLQGLRAATANPTNATGGNTVASMGDKAGRQVVTPGNVRELIGVQTTVISASTAETTIVTAGGAGVFNDISCIVITTTDVAAAVITIKDATAGTTRMTLHIPATAAKDGPLCIPFPIPMPQAAAANNWTATVSVNAGAVAINVVYVKNL